MFRQLVVVAVAAAALQPLQIEEVFGWERVILENSSAFVLPQPRTHGMKAVWKALLL
jgi:hypothetical protein